MSGITREQLKETIEGLLKANALLVVGEEEAEDVAGESLHAASAMLERLKADEPFQKEHEASIVPVAMRLESDPKVQWIINLKGPIPQRELRIFRRSFFRQLQEHNWEGPLPAIMNCEGVEALRVDEDGTITPVEAHEAA